MVAARVGQEDLCRALLDDRVRDWRVQRVARALRGKQHQPILFADGLQLVLRKIAEPLVL
ncbi:hypothetical protein D3C87_2075060 [compost metagenome]